ncbi:SDR family oxidoreductase [Spiractinospora alimapuensis]|uniref:SDR family NAD(P)-dependent oxidoreductase n=1 Tax=Spiractinospora alimapuensis TaxID=2820884 RepID=UPI001F32ED15|nr:SDR family oxidoreductase [Spiractinospora alimapuensis]QVQ54403.1 SDR family oxidoreductase [Spiractinospora alimapuensis]
MAPQPPSPEEIRTALRVLRYARDSPDAPEMAAVHTACAHTHRAAKKQRTEQRRAAQRDADDQIRAAAERHRSQNPTAEPGTPPITTVVGTLSSPQPCYVCRQRYRDVASDYHRLCPGCASVNRDRRYARCDLRGRHALVTGGRVKIGFHTALKLLRDGARVTVTTRFPRDAARRYAAVSDSETSLPRLRVVEADFLNLRAVAALLDDVREHQPHLDILVNNAAQTIRRPTAYHREVLAAERLPLTGSAATVEVHTAPVGDGANTLELTRGGALAALPPTAADLFPSGAVDENGEPLDLRSTNSWRLRLHQVNPAEWLECHLVNAFVPFLLTGQLRELMEASPAPDRYVVQVSAMEGRFDRWHKPPFHPHTNMAKAGLNMLTRTAAADYAESGIFMNAVDTGWVTDENPHPIRRHLRANGFRPPLDAVDGAARVYDPIVRGVNGSPVFGEFLKDYQPISW